MMTDSLKPPTSGPSDAEREALIAALDEALADLRRRAEDLRVQAHLAKLDGGDIATDVLATTRQVEVRAREVIGELRHGAGVLGRSLQHRSSEVLGDVEAAIGGVIIALRGDDHGELHS